MKLLSLGFLLSITLFSCSNDEKSTSNSDSTLLTLPKKITYIENRDNTKTEKNKYFTYDGNKIVNHIEEEDKTIYTYSGDLITKIDEYHIDKLWYTTYLTYTDNKLISMSFKNIGDPYYTSNYTETTSYVHNLDGTISYSSKSTKGKLTFKDGNVVEDATETNGTTKYEYDTKQNPFRNILGMSAALYNYYGDHNLASKSNITKEIDIYNGKTSTLTTNTLTYNSNGYPIEIKNSNEGLTGYYTTYKYYYE